MDLGCKDFVFTVKIKTEQRDGVLIGKMVPANLCAPGSSTRGIWKILYLRDGCLSLDVSGVGRLDGILEVSDGQEHEVLSSDFVKAFA